MSILSARTLVTGFSISALAKEESESGRQNMEKIDIKFLMEL